MDSEQKYAATNAMVAWLSDPHELGKAPLKIECVSDFVLHEMHYYIFRYKRTLLGKWLLGVCGGYVKNELEHCGHVFSEMSEYDERTAHEECVQMVEMIRSYWMEKAKKFTSSKSN